MNKPYVIIHTHTSIDGNLDIMDLSEFKEASRQYQEIALDPEKQQFLHSRVFEWENNYSR